MGYRNAYDMAQFADLDTALRWHLEANLYPPPPAVMFRVAREALLLALDDDTDETITLPEGVEWQGSDTIPAWAAIEAFRLEALIDAYREDPKI